MGCLKRYRSIRAFLSVRNAMKNENVLIRVKEPNKVFNVTEPNIVEHIAR